MAEEAIGTQIGKQFSNFFNSLSITRRVILFGSLAVVLIGMGTMVYLSNRTNWTILYSDISVQDAALIKSKLDGSQIQVLVGAGGNSILVPANVIDEARIVLARERISLGAGMGFADLFVENQGMGETEFQQQVKYRMALEGELERLINTLNNVRSSEVTLALPQRSAFLREDKEATASVLVVSDRGQEINYPQVLTIANLVANGVEDLNYKDVVIVDDNGRLLSKYIDDPAGGTTISDQLMYRLQIERELERKILTQLEPIVGNGRVSARVSVDVDFNSLKVSEEIYDPDNSVVRSEQSASENTTGSRSIPVGIPGVSANLPETQAGASEVANVSQQEKLTETRNYENSVVRRENIVAVGAVKRLSVSILIDGKYRTITDGAAADVVTRQYEEWTTAEKQQIEKLAKASVGFDTNRGDVLEVINLRFTSTQEEQLEEQTTQLETNRQFSLDILRYTFLGVGILALILFVARPMVLRLKTKPEDLDILMGLPASVGELEEEELEIPSETGMEIPPREQVIEMARSEPLATASLIRIWLRSK